VRMPYSSTAPGTDFFTVRQLQSHRAIVLLLDFHLRFLVPRCVHDDPRYGTFGELSWTLSLEEEREGHTRLVLRMQAKYKLHPYQTLIIQSYS
jgi:hypothetical protein